MTAEKPDPVKIAYEAAEAIRQLNHVTLNECLPAPRISATMQALVVMLDRLPQLFEQLAHQLQQRQAEGKVVMDTREDPAIVVAEVLAQLADAKAIAEPAHYSAYGTPAGALSKTVHAAASSLFSMAAK
ncbi:hypothetical protein P3T36_004879 [Kitasatospora sp. MAP12-15]|uniref:hypothetical protein n=1 Tax=unclassified Kitasatospora TaxID=2633591 RepID=UPI002474C44D|nr:hypothetical protein [Kitasatospora sp. MAP12-44]MDH6110189.1 hypothetical protein [Kitasatospora sp. MAP12-44]